MFLTVLQIFAKKWADKIVLRQDSSYFWKTIILIFEEKMLWSYRSVASQKINVVKNNSWILEWYVASLWQWLLFGKLLEFRGQKSLQINPNAPS